jgi:hypothetical protein
MPASQFLGKSVAYALACLGLAVAASTLAVSTASAQSATKPITVHAPSLAQDDPSTLAENECGHESDSLEWHFVINQIDVEDNAPSSITVFYSDFTSEVVPLDKATNGVVAHYVTRSKLDQVVLGASATIYSSWNGQFNLSHGPCANTTGGGGGGGGGGGSGGEPPVATPELGSLALLGGGMSGLVGYGLTRWRARRRTDTE